MTPPLSQKGKLGLKVLNNFPQTKALMEHRVQIQIVCLPMEIMLLSSMQYDNEL